MRTYADYVARLQATHPNLAMTFASFITLEQVLNWMQRDGLPLASLDMVTQDEYCHDLIVPVGHEWFVFGMT